MPRIKQYKRGQSKFYQAAFDRGWHFADSCMLKCKTPTEKEILNAQEFAVEHAKEIAKGANEHFSEKDAITIFRTAYNGYPSTL